MMEEFAVNALIQESQESSKNSSLDVPFYNLTTKRELHMNVNIIGNTVPTSFDIVCSNCAWTGVLTTPQPENLSELSVGEKINFTNGDGDSHKCPSCNIGYIYGVSGKYKRNKESNHMDRIGDYEK